MQRWLIWILAHVDQRLVYGFMGLFVIPGYMLFAHSGYITQYRFFRERMGMNWWKAFVHVYKNHFSFGQIIIDRFAAYGGKKFRLEFDDYSIWDQLDNDDDQGFVQVSSHVGNFEISGYLLKPRNRKINALVYQGETETVMHNRARLFTPNNIHMVSVMPDMSHIFVLNNALAEGEVVSMPGDRIFGSQKSVECMLLGKAARFPVGPFQLAVSRGCPLLTIFCMKEDWQTYHIYISQLEAPGKEIDRRERAAYYAKQFAVRLEDILRRYPTQWFNYYDFWK